MLLKPSSNAAALGVDKHQRQPPTPQPPGSSGQQKRKSDCRQSFSGKHRKITSSRQYTVYAVYFGHQDLLDHAVSLISMNIPEKARHFPREGWDSPVESAFQVSSKWFVEGDSLYRGSACRWHRHQESIIRCFQKHSETTPGSLSSKARLFRNKHLRPRRSQYMSISIEYICQSTCRLYIGYYQYNQIVSSTVTLTDLTLSYHPVVAPGASARFCRGGSLLNRWFSYCNHHNCPRRMTCLIVCLGFALSYCFSLVTPMLRRMYGCVMFCSRCLNDQAYSNILLCKTWLPYWEEQDIYLLWIRKAMMARGLG